MSNLHTIQRLFRDALLTNDEAPLTAWIRQNDSTRPDPARRLGIYRNNVFTNLSETLRTLYPVIERLVGTDFFDYAAKHYIQTYPSPAGDLNRFGAQLADFLADFKPAADLPYLPDTARLEWYTHEVYHAGEHPSLIAEQLAEVPTDRYESLHFNLNPATRLFASGYPVHRIWQVNQAGYEGDQQVDIGHSDVRLLIERRDRRIELQALDKGEWTLLESLATNQSLASAASAAIAVETDFDLTASLSRLIAQSTLVAFSVDKHTG